MGHNGHMEWSISNGPVQPKIEVHLKKWTAFFETFPVGPNRSIQFWTINFRQFWLNGLRPSSYHDKFSETNSLGLSVLKSWGFFLLFRGPLRINFTKSFELSFLHPKDALSQKTVHPFIFVHMRCTPVL